MVAGALALLPIAISGPAAVASGGAEVSFDGVAYSGRVTGSIFTSVNRMVPGDSQQASFTIRNGSSRPAFVRIVMKDARYDDAALAGAMTFSADAAGAAAAVVPLLQAAPCWVLSEGQVISPGGTLRVTAAAQLGDLDGTAGQNATAAVDFGVSLSDIPPGTLAPDDCGSVDIAIPAIPSSATAAPATPPAGGMPGRGSSASGDVVPGEPGELPVLAQPGVRGIDPNTWHLWEELLILIPIGSALLGAFLYRVVFWRRGERRHGEGEA